MAFTATQGPLGPGLEQLVRRAVRAAEGEPMVFFLGAGASAASPSCLPMPETIQRSVLREVAPSGRGVERDVEALTDSLPEIYHEILLHLGGPAAVEIWRCLSFWESASGEPSLMKAGLGPNVTHLVTVYLAWRSRTPLITVNFDRMLELAAIRLGLRPIVDFNACTEGDTVAIWKLHGSVSDPGSIRTTLQSITATDPTQLEAIRDEFRRAQGCLIGYSGRDIDFFPFLCEWTDAVRPIHWLNLDFEGTALKRFPHPFNPVEGTGAEVWARETIQQLPGSDPRTDLLRQELAKPLPDRSRVEPVYRRAVEVHAERLYRPMFGADEGRRLLAHALALAAIGHHERAWEWLDQFFAAPREPRLECRAELLRASLSHERSLYLDSERYARNALAIARRQSIPDQTIEATIAVDEARRMANTARFDCARRRDVAWPGALLALLRMLWHGWRFRRMRKPPPARHGSNPDFDRLRAGFAYLEHLIRTGAFFQRAIEGVVSRRIVQARMRAYWHWIAGLCEKSGYAFGIANAKKFELRTALGEERDREALSAYAVYELVSSPTGLAIDYRDRGQAALRRAAASDGHDQARLRAEAKELLEEGLAYAEQAGNRSLQLKLMEGQRQVDPSFRVPRAQVEALLDAIQGPAYDRLRSRIIQALCE